MSTLISSATLSGSVANDLRQRISRGDWGNGDRLPGEHALASEYGVSRATIRTALQDLESRGITVTRRGVGTFVTGQSSGVRADLRQLESLSATIQAHGRTPNVVYRSISVRAATPAEQLALQMEETGEVLATERALTADGETVAYSRDVIPRHLLGPDFSPTDVEGSLFALLESHGVRAVSAVTDLHAVHDPELGWGDRPENPTYLLLVQLHFDQSGTPVAMARTYFVEGRFQWGLVRHR
ncbi:MAG: GntR family transcriptional regulator [Actinomycetota bacterium]